MWIYGQGFPKGKSCLKPAWEPIILARKPGPMRELGIEECRVASPDAARVGDTSRSDSIGYGAATWQKSGTTPPSGRWPANLILECTCDETREGTAKTGTAVRGRGGRGATHGIYGAGMGAYPACLLYTSDA